MHAKRAKHTSKKKNEEESAVCSPAVLHRGKHRKNGSTDEDVVPGTCLRRRDVIEVARWYNRDTPQGRARPVVFSDEEQTLEQLHRAFGTRKGEEHLWLSSPSSAAILDRAFRPVMPASWLRNENTWLSNHDIERVMRQYEEMLPDFWFVGVFPMDFDTILDDGKCVSVELCGLSVDKMLREGKSHAGVILNIDKHYQSGSHWVALYVDLCPASVMYGVYYYDSVAKPPHAEVRRFAERVCDEVRRLRQRENRVEHAAAVCRNTKTNKKKKLDFEFSTNPVRRQYQNTECGIFAMLFLVCCMSRDMDFPYICTHMGKDEHLQALRRVFFRAPPASTATTTRKKGRR